MNTMSAQELKQGGLSAIKKLLNKVKEIIVQDRGKDTCAVIDLEYFNQLKLCELEVAYLKAQEDIKNGRFEVVTDVQEHVNKLLQEIDAEGNNISKHKK